MFARRTNLTQKETQIFDALIHNPYLSQQDLADVTGLSRSTVANILSDLNNRGYIIGKPYEINTKKIITCIGGANVDYKMSINGKVIQGSSNPVTKTSSLGGVIRNVAENLARLGQDVSLMTRVGTDSEGDRIIREASTIMNVFAVDKVADKSTGSYTAILDNSGELFIGLADMQICEDMNREWILSHRPHINMSEIVVCDTNIKSSAIEAVNEVNLDKKLIIVGVSVAKIVNIPKSVDNVYLIILNKDEAKALTNIDDDMLLVCEKLKKMGFARAVVTMGEKGVIYYDEENSPTIIEAKKIDDVVDVTGAGDSFTAGVIYGLANGKDICESCKYGMTMSSYTIMSHESVRSDLSAKIFENLI